MFRSSSSPNLHIPTPLLLHFRTANLHFRPFLGPLRNASLAVASPSLLLSSPTPKPLSAVNCSLSDGDGDWPPAPETGSPLELKKRAMYMCDGLKGTSIFLIGMKSSMKSSVGKLLAEVLRYYYFDSDELVEEAAGGAAAVKLMKETDEKAYRESETEVLKQLSAIGRLVVCAGDGAVESSFNMTLLRDGISVWIDIPLDRLAGGVVEQNNEVLAQLVAQYQALRSRYASADTTISLQRVAGKFGYVDLAEVTADDMALEVLSGIEKLTRVKKLMEEAAAPF